MQFDEHLISQLCFWVTSDRCTRYGRLQISLTVLTVIGVVVQRVYKMAAWCMFCFLYMHLCRWQLIDEFTDVNEGEKELMKLWNLHVMHHK